MPHFVWLLLLMCSLLESCIVLMPHLANAEVSCVVTEIGFDNIAREESKDRSECSPPCTEDLNTPPLLVAWSRATRATGKHTMWSAKLPSTGTERDKHDRVEHRRISFHLPRTNLWSTLHNSPRFPSQLQRSASPPSVTLLLLSTAGS